MTSGSPPVGFNAARAFPPEPAQVFGPIFLGLGPDDQAAGGKAADTSDTAGPSPYWLGPVLGCASQ